GRGRRTLVRLLHGTSCCGTPRLRGRVGVGGSGSPRSRPPSRPSPASGGRGAQLSPPRPARDTRSPPRLRGGLGRGQVGTADACPGRDTRSLPRLRGGWGWGQWVAADPAPSRPSPASGGRGAQSSPHGPPPTPPPAPACGGGLGWGAVGRIGPGPHPGLPPQGGAGRTVVTPRPVHDTRVHGIRHINQIISDRFSPLLQVSRRPCP